MRTFHFACCLLMVAAGGCQRGGETTVAQRRSDNVTTATESQAETSTAAESTSAVAGSAERADTRSQPPGTGTYGDFIVGVPLHHKNLTIFPISSKVPKNEDRFVTLDEGRKAATVRIVEVGADSEEERSQAIDQDDAAVEDQDVSNEAANASPQTDDAVSSGEDFEDLFGEWATETGTEGEAEVNTLLVHNRSEKPLYLMPGEVISGGNQDRTIAEELVIHPSDKPVPVDVFCVEHGRWQDADVEQTATMLAVAG